MKHCLIVDDSAVIRKVACRILEALGFEVTDVESAAQAIAFCREAMPELIIVDSLMPETDGFEFVRELRRMPDGGVSKVIVAIIENDVATVARVYHVGGDVCLTKPFTTETMRRKLEEVGLLEAADAA